MTHKKPKEIEQVNNNDSDYEKSRKFNKNHEKL